MECKCGNKGCSTNLEIYRDVGRIDIRIAHKEKGEDKLTDISLDANSIVQLIRELKNALSELT